MTETKTGKDLGFEPDNPFYDAPVISEYTDKQAVDDGVLVSFSGPGRINRVTRPVWNEFTEDIGGAGIITNITELTAAANAALEAPLEDGWYTKGEFKGHKLWVLPNGVPWGDGVEGRTLMFPSDY